jgi:replication-associated recombination protein RarA
MEHEAAHFAFELDDFNSTMLWNRLKIIAAEDIGPANPTMPLLIDLLQRQYLSEKAKLAESTHQLYLIDAISCLCRSPKSRVTDDLLGIINQERAENKLPPIPDFAIDMHTKQGKILGRGIDHFFSEGNRLENEAFANPYTEKVKALRMGKPEEKQ